MASEGAGAGEVPDRWLPEELQQHGGLGIRHGRQHHHLYRILELFLAY